MSLSTASLSVRKASGHPSVEDSLNQRLGCVAEMGTNGVMIETCCIYIYICDVLIDNFIGHVLVKGIVKTEERESGDVFAL